MQGQWNRGHAYYRCKYPNDYPGTEDSHPRSISVKEAAVTPSLDRWLGQLFDDDHVDHTCDTLAGVSEPDVDAVQRKERLRAGIADCDRRIGRYHQLLDYNTDPALVASWVAEAQRERTALETQLGEQIPGEKLTSAQVKALVQGFRDIVATLAKAAPADKADLYNELGVTLRYDTTGSVAVQLQPRGVTVRVGGASRTLSAREADVGRRGRRRRER